jgi:hypothetical protein
VDAVNETVAETTTPRLAGLVATLDRWFPLLWLGLYAALPMSGWASETFSSWFDQMRDLRALEQLLEQGSADAIADSVIGPAYIGAAALIHELTGLSPEDSLVALTRASYALSIAAGLLLVRVLVRRWTGAPPMVTLASQLAFAGLVFAAGTWYWSDVPWSHFFAAFLGVAFYASRYGPARATWPTAAIAGCVLALLATTRSFELVAVLLAWGIVGGGLAALRLSGPRRWSPLHAGAGVAAFLVTTAVVYAGTGKRDLFLLYGNHLDRQSGDVASAEIAETPTFSFGFVPTKLVQLFVDPCYLSLCELSDYQTGGGDGTNIALWGLPLAVQLPMLALLPLCLVALGYLAVRSLRRRQVARELSALLEMSVAATGIVVGYAASTMTGPAHLQYGFARDFLLSAALVAIVAVVLGAVGLWRFLQREGRAPRFSPEIAFVMGAVAVAAVAVVASTTARSTGLPRVESRHLGSVSYTAKCAASTCIVRSTATTTDGEQLSLPGASTLTFGCGSEQPRFSMYVASLGRGVQVRDSCRDPVLLAAWPTVMGLPPGSFELAAVQVRNL